MVNMGKKHLKSLCVKNKTLNGLLSLLGYSNLDYCVKIRPYINSEDSLISLFENDLTSELIVCLGPFYNELFIGSQLL